MAPVSLGHFVNFLGSAVEQVIPPAEFSLSATYFEVPCNVVGGQRRIRNVVAKRS